MRIPGLEWFLWPSRRDRAHSSLKTWLTMSGSSTKDVAKELKEQQLVMRPPELLFYGSGASKASPHRTCIWWLVHWHQLPGERWLWFWNPACITFAYQVISRVGPRLVFPGSLLTLACGLTPSWASVTAPALKPQPSSRSPQGLDRFRGLRFLFRELISNFLFVLDIWGVS